MQRVLLQTVRTVEVVSASVLNAVLATISLRQLCAAVSYFTALLYILGRFITTSHTESNLVVYFKMKFNKKQPLFD